MEKPHSDADDAKKIKKLTLLDGSRVGIVNLENIIKEIANLKLTDTKTIKAELLKKAASHNYIPSSAKNDYATVLFQEYRRKFGEGADKIETRKPPGG
jgi:hypothetical protein